MAVKCLSGSIFRVRSWSGLYLFGRITVDLQYVERKRLLPAGASIAGFGKAAVVEMYTHVSRQSEFVESDVAIAGAIVDRTAFGDEWKVIGFKRVMPEDVDFPQAVVGSMHESGETAFRWSEISHPLPFSEKWHRELGVYTTWQSVRWWPEICLGVLGRPEDVDPSFRHAANLEKSDLRFHPRRGEVYRRLPFDATRGYFTAQSALGLDVSRLVRYQAADAPAS